MMPVVGVAQLGPRTCPVTLVSHTLLIGKPFAEVGLTNGVTLVGPRRELHPASGGVDTRIKGRADFRLRTVIATYAERKIYKIP